MRIQCFSTVLMIVAAGIAVAAWSPVRAGDLIVDLGKAVDISMAGAVQRWDEEGKPRFPVDPKAKIAEPRVDARAVRQGSGKWVFRNLPPGRYDFVILGADHLRVEGFRYPPITEFDPFLPPDAGGPEQETRDWIVKHIAGSKHYENKVVPLFLSGDEKQVRILIQLVRDLPTVNSYSPLAVRVRLLHAGKWFSANSPLRPSDGCELSSGALHMSDVLASSSGRPALAMTRRGFARTLVGSALGTLAMPAVLRGRNLAETLNIALVGVGGRGADNHKTVAGRG